MLCPTLSVIHWKALIGKSATTALFKELATGLSVRSQAHALFSTYELNPELFESRFAHLSSHQRKRLQAALAIARDYALFREAAYQKSRERLREYSEVKNHLIQRMLPLEARLSAREWIGFWAQYRQGHWSELEIVERGVRTHVNFDVSEFFARLLATRPRAFVLVHNHPSGLTTPSRVDLELTSKMDSLSRQFNIELQGHWIVGPHSEHWIAPGSAGVKP